MHRIPNGAARWAIIGLSAALLLAASPATATDNNMGTIKVHDGPSADPPQRNQPHVDCEFWIEGFNMADSSGRIEIRSWPPTGDKSLVLTTSWTGTPEADGKGHHFLVGPLTLAAGHYRVEAFSATGHPGNPGHFAKAKMFWVEPCVPTPPPPPTTTNPPPTGTLPPPPPPTTNPPAALACPEDLLAVANGDGSITLTFAAAAGSDGTNVYRVDADGDYELLATLDAGVGTYTDLDTEAGAAYVYAVTALFGDRESVGCQEIEVSAIPDFPTLLGAGLATSGGLLALFLARRRLA